MGRVTFSKHLKDCKEEGEPMRKWGAVLLLAVSIFISACASKQADVPVTEVLVETAAYTAAAETTEEQSVPETEGPIEAKPLTENNTSRRISLDAAELRPDNGVWALGGSKVCFGQYDGIPTAYRVLALPDTQTVPVGKDSLLLDCDTTLKMKAFDDNFSRNAGQAKQPSEWKGSDIEAWLNGNDFYGSGCVFSDIEKAAIVRTVLDENSTPCTIGNWTYEDYGSTDKVFLLSAAEANSLYAENAARAKDGSSNCWWLRSAFGSSGNGAGSVHGDGHICNNSITNFGVGVSPALNIDLSSVLFVSTVEADNAQDQADPEEKAEDSTSMVWKMTLLDTGKTVNVTDGKTVTRTDTNAGVVIAVPYTYAGKDVTRISVVITDRAYTDDGAQVLYYGALQEVSGNRTTGTGAFVLPADLKDQICGTNYYAYLIAENVNGDHQTDYASHFYAIAIPSAPTSER